jgi:hypothetical protein
LLIHEGELGGIFGHFLIRKIVPPNEICRNKSFSYNALRRFESLLQFHFSLILHGYHDYFTVASLAGACRLDFGLLCCGGLGKLGDDAGNRHLVCGASETELDAAELAFWTGLDVFVSLHGRVGVAGVAAGWFCKCSGCFDGVFLPVVTECWLVVVLFRTASAGFGFCGNSFSLGGDFDHTFAVLAEESVCRDIAFALFALGVVCGGFEFLLFCSGMSWGNLCAKKGVGVSAYVVRI